MLVTPFCVLRHDLPGGAWHYDWLLARTREADPDERDLIAFRTGESPTDAAIEAFEAVRLADHRRMYLTYEGVLPADPAGQGRGRVRRVDSGECRIVLEAPQRLSVLLTGIGSPALWQGHGQGDSKGTDGVWMFRREHL